MARDKMLSISADEIATNTVKEEQSIASSNRSANIPFKKKISNKRSVEVNGDTSPTNGTYQQHSSSSSSSSSYGRKGSGLSTASNMSAFSGNANSRGSILQRTTKTLAWFLNDELLSATSTENTHRSKSNSQSSTSSSAFADRTVEDMKGDVEKIENSSATTTTTHFDERKRGRRTRQRSQKKNIDAKPRSDSSSNSEDVHDTKPTTKSEHSKDDYWYYDPTSDGFYYENMGSRGWRRRVPVNAQKRLRVEQEMYAAFLRDPSQFACLHPDLYGFPPNVPGVNNPYYVAPQIKYYDPASDGYYFEMPSVDGWKKRQPNSSSVSSSGQSSSNTCYSYPGVNYLRSPYMHHEQPQVTSYGAALARGQLPPAYTLADSAVCSQDPFSSGASSMSTLSSVSEGTPTPPPLNHMNTTKDRNGSLFPNDGNLDEYLAEQYDRAFQLDELSNGSNTEDNGSDDSVSLHLPSYLFERTESIDNAETSYDADDLENRPPNKESEIKRPGTLHLNPAPLEDTEQTKKSDTSESKQRNGHELLLNFNADKFIADLAFCGTNVERVLRDLAALKTPVTASANCNTDSPQTPAIYSAFPNWARASDTESENSHDWWLQDISSLYIDDIWSRNAPTCSNAKSKLSVWRDAELLTAVPCDNN